MSTKGLLLGCGLLALSSPVIAQTASSADPRAPEIANETAAIEEEPSIGEIVVTAQRRSQRLQDVPIAITVVSGETLRENRFTDLSDIQYLAPSLTFTPAPAQTYFSVRGIGSQSFDYGVEQSVGFSLDDVIQTLPRVQPLTTLADIDRVEVLRGPQGTLFGKNTTAGLVSITTKRPELNTFSGETHLQYGSRNEIQTYGIVNVPITDKLATRFRAAYLTRDSIYRNLAGGRIRDTRAYELNGKLLWEPTDQLSVYLIAYLQGNQDDGGVFSTRSFGIGTFAPGVGDTFVRDTQTAVGIVPGPANRRVALGVGGFQDTKTRSAQGTVNYKLGEATLTSVTAYKNLNYVSQLEVDSSPLTVFDNNIGTIDAHQFTQELRLSSATGGFLEYVIGAFYYDQKIGSTQRQSGGLGFLPNAFPLELAVNGGLFNFGATNRSIAAFADGTFRPTDRLRFLGGVRYTDDRVTGTNFTTAIPGVCGLSLVFAGICQVQTFPTPTIRNRNKDGQFSGRVGIQFDATDRIMAYATASRGYKSAAISTLSSVAYVVRPEKVIAYEAGLKAQVLDRRLSVNASIFRENFRDFQAQVFDASAPPAGAFRTGNAGRLRSQGAELDFVAQPFTGLSLTGGVTYNDAKFTEYLAQCFPGQTPMQGCNLPGPAFDASGERLPNAPEWRFNVGGNYETELGTSLRGFVNANYAYQSSVFFGVGNPGTRQNGYGLLNLSAGIADADNHVRFAIFARNLLDKQFAYIAPTPFDTGGLSNLLPDAAFRRIGASLDFRF